MMAKIFLLKERLALHEYFSIAFAGYHLFFTPNYSQYSQ